MDRTFELALAGLLHDVGKFAQRADALRDRADPESYCPADPRTHRRTHIHAALSAAFVDEYLPWLTDPGRGSNQVAGFAGRHHAPSSHADWVVTLADRWASGMDRGAKPDGPDFDRGYWHRRVLPARLRPILASVGVAEPEEAYLPLTPLDATPEALCERSPSLPSATDSLEAYRHHWNAFLEELKRISTTAGAPLGERIRCFLPTFAALFEKYAWCIPAATDDALADISLYDHSRAVAALAAALWRELGPEEAEVAGRPEAEVKDTAAPRFTLLVGDLSGIQRFLYSIASAGAARLLRGRSFYLQLLTEGIGRALLRRLGLPPTNLIYAGGGKLWLLAHASGEPAARELAEEIDAALLRAHGAGLSFTLGAATASGSDFLQKRVSALWQRALADAASSRRRRLRALAAREPGLLFDPFGGGGDEEPCRACGFPVVATGISQEPRCQGCTVQEHLGRMLPRARWLLVEDLTAPGAELGPSGEPRGQEVTLRLGAPLGVAFHLWPEKALPSPDREPTFDLALRLDGTNFLQPAPDGDGRSRGFWMVARNRPEASEAAAATATFEELALRSEGAPLLAVLRLDVDNLGRVFAPERAGGLLPDERASLSRVATLSRQLAYFFGGLVGWLVREEAPSGSGAWTRNDRLQIIYSGGDDAFVVGAWSDVLDLAAEVRNRFREFAANPSLGISAGVALVDAHHPIAAAAELAGELEAAAKAHRRESGREKDAIAVIGPEATVSWEEFDIARAMVKALQAGIEGGHASRALVFRLHEVAAAWQRSLPPKGPTTPGALRGALARSRWAWMAAYSLPRALRNGSGPSPLAWVRRAEDWLAGAEAPLGSPAPRGDRPVLTYLPLIARWAELATRSRGDER